MARRQEKRFPWDGAIFGLLGAIAGFIVGAAFGQLLLTGPSDPPKPTYHTMAIPSGVRVRNPVVLQIPGYQSCSHAVVAASDAIDYSLDSLHCSIQLKADYITDRAEVRVVVFGDTGYATDIVTWRGQTKP